MTDTEPLPRTADTDSRLPIDPGTAEGRSKLLLFGGMGGLAVGTMLDVATVVWGGVVVILVAFLLNTAGKLVHYGDLSITREERLKLSLSWVLLAATVVGLLVNYAYTRYGPGGGSFFWALAAAGVGFGLLHMAAQSKYLPADRQPDGS